MMQLFDALTDSEKAEIENNWGTTLEELKVLAQRHDRQVFLDSIPAEEKRTKTRDK